MPKTETTPTTGRPTKNYDPKSEQNAALAAAAEKHGDSITGKHVGIITRATHKYTSEKGAEILQLDVQLENGKVYKLEEEFLSSGEDKGYKELPFYGHFMQLLELTNASPELGDCKVMDFGVKADGSYGEMEKVVEGFPGLIGKQVGMIIKYYQKYPTSLAVNGYTNRPIPTKQENPEAYELAKKDPTTVWMPNYNKETEPIFKVVMFYDQNSGKSRNELMDDNLDFTVKPDGSTYITKDDKEVPSVLQAEMDKIAKNHSPAARKLSDKNGNENAGWDIQRMKALKANLKRANIAFDQNKFIPLNGTGKISEADVDDSII